jgi:hypothetical protein
MSARFPSLMYSITSRLAGLVLTVAGVLKSVAPAPDGNAIGLSSNSYVQAPQAAAEVLLGLWLLTGLLPRAAWWLATACFCAFLGISLFRAFSGESSCGCFGALHIHPWVTAALDGLLLFGLIAFRPARFSQPVPVRRRAAWAVIGLVALVAGGIPLLRAAAHSPAQDFDASDSADILDKKPVDWARQRLPLLRHIDIGDRLASGRWIVMLYRWNCGKCQQALPQYIGLSHALVGDASGIRVALIELPPFADTVSTAPPQ